MPDPTPETVDLSDPLVTTLAAAAFGVEKAIEALTGCEADPNLARFLALFAVGSFLNAGGLDLTTAEAGTIAAMLDDAVFDHGASGRLQ